MLSWLRRRRPKNTFRPYRAVTGSICMDSVLGDVQTYKTANQLSNPHDYYVELVRFIADDPRYVVRPMCKHRSPAPADVVRVAFRHDVDIDPWSAVSLAEVLHRAGISGTFYLLHTSIYYGVQRDAHFERYTGVAEQFLRIQNEFGCEVGLHVDGLKYYQAYGIDGAHAVLTELEWLRSRGLRIVGTAAHNSAPLYGAENFELFAGRAVFGRSQLERNGLVVPLQTIDEQLHDLEYEANFAEVDRTVAGPAVDAFLTTLPNDGLRDRAWMRSYLVDNPYLAWGADYNLWLVGPDRWVIGGHQHRDPAFLWEVNLREVFDFLRSVPAGRDIVVHVHPIYIHWKEPVRAAA